MDERFRKTETGDLLERIEQNIRRRLAGSVHNLHLILCDDGLVIRGCVRTYHSKQLAQQAVMEITKLRIRANEIKVTQQNLNAQPFPENGGSIMDLEANQKDSETTYAPMAEDIMDHNCLIISEQMPVREAATLLRRKGSHMAAVIDENGRCAGILQSADVFRWIEGRCPNVLVGAGGTCPYQLRGRLLNGDDGVICTLAHGSCAFQVEHPTTGGRHTDLCVRRGTSEPPFGATPRYMTTDFVTIRPKSKLFEIVRHMIDSRTEGLVVLDEFNHPAGIISAVDILLALDDCMHERAATKKTPVHPRKPR